MLRQIREAKQQQDEEAEGFESRLETFAQILQTHESQAEAQKTRIDSLISQHQETFLTAQENRSSEYSSFISEKGGTFRETQDEHASKFEALHQQQAEAGQERIDNLQESCDRAKEIVGIIGNIGVTGNYQKIANEEKKAANVFRWIAVGCFVAMLIAVILVLHSSFSAEACDWSMALFRVITAAIFAVPGIYCAMESNKHRKIEQENRRLELELASISPFLEKIDDKDAETILKELAPKYFGNHVANNDGTPLVNIDPKSVESVLKPIIELVKLMK